jgi:hypothetical protein
MPSGSRYVTFEPSRISAASVTSIPTARAASASMPSAVFGDAVIPLMVSGRRRAEMGDVVTQVGDCVDPRMRTRRSRQAAEFGG